MNIILISIVIPVYNKETYLNACLESVVNQTYEKLEIIIINDGSVDNSKDIINKWKQKDNRIKHFDQINQGVAMTRNKGITVSKGEYVYFIDADDYIELTAIEILVNHSTKVESDIIVGNYSLVKNNKIKKKQALKNRTLYPTDLLHTETKAEMFLLENRPLASSCNKLYKLSFIENGKLKFKDNIFAEDRLFNLMCYLEQPTITIVNDYTYYYNILEVSRSKTFPDNFFNTCISLLYELSDYLKEKNITKDNKDLLQINAIYEMDNILNNYYNYYQNTKGLKKSIELMKSDELIYSILKQVNNDKILRRISINKMYYIRFTITLKFYLNTSSFITAFVYFLYKKLISATKQIKK